ncbi:MAG: CehA/McbA family metallohydrolase [Deltaproteobacteria bacterium]|nr:CehA/McbA family metallohydrolase [Deltaproteobacteria bacterium]
MMLGRSFIAVGCACAGWAMGCRVDPESVSTQAARDEGSGTVTHARPQVVKTGELIYEVLDEKTGKRTPAKLTINGTRGTRDPRFSRGDIGREDEDEQSLAAFNRVFTMSGAGKVTLPAGSYDVTISRGPEWTISVHRVSIGAKPVAIAGKIKHVIETPKWVSGDFHVHAASSPDSRVPMRDRVYEFVADGVDMIVSTDHNVAADYAPHIKELNAGKWLASAIGNEVTSGEWGHFGAFPLPQEMVEEGQGAIPTRRKSAKELFGSIRELAPGAIIDVHHPRLEEAIGYFYLGRFDEKTDRAGRKGFSYDFDAVELLNGYQDTNRKSLDRTMADWFALLGCGHMVTATGNSDTHHLTYNLGGYPRNYVLVDNDDPAVVTPKMVAKGLRARHAFFTTAPFVSFTVGSAGIGDVAPAPGGRAKAEIVVRAAPWVSVSRVIVYVGGKIERTFEVAKSEAVERFRMVYDLQVAKDTHVVVRVEGDQPLTPVVGGSGSVAITPLALTNPIFLDVNGNGKYDPINPHGAHVPAKDDPGADKPPAPAGAGHRH